MLGFQAVSQLALSEFAAGAAPPAAAAGGGGFNVRRREFDPDIYSEM